MQYALISDIHGDLALLQSVINDIQKQGITRIVCLGDIIGRGGNSKECWDMVRDNCFRILAGNHDMAASGRTRAMSFPERDRAGIDDARDKLYFDDKYVSLPVKDSIIHYDNLISLVHASPIEPIWEFISSTDDARSAFAADNAPIICHGHTHMASWADNNGQFNRIWTKEALKAFNDDGEMPKITFKQNRRYLLNPGAVLKNGEWALLTEKYCEWHRVKQQ